MQIYIKNMGNYKEAIIQTFYASARHDLMNESDSIDLAIKFLSAASELLPIELGGFAYDIDDIKDKLEDCKPE